jgi:hypothetical protein
MSDSSNGTLTKADLEELIEQVYKIADDSGGGTKEEMREALSEIADLTDSETEVERDKDGKWFVVDESDDEDLLLEGDDEDDDE